MKEGGKLTLSLQRLWVHQVLSALCVLNLCRLFRWVTNQVSSWLVGLIWKQNMVKRGGGNIHEIYLAFHYSVHDAVIRVSAFVVAF